MLMFRHRDARIGSRTRSRRMHEVGPSGGVASARGAPRSPNAHLASFLPLELQVPTDYAHARPDDPRVRKKVQL